MPLIFSSSTINIRKNNLITTSYFSKTFACIAIKLKNSTSLNHITQINNYD